MSVIPKGFCQCGCGEPTAICDRNWKRFGYVKGDPFRFLPSHSSRARRDANIYTNSRVNGSYKLEHLLIAERALGKPLPKGAQVHHVDENRRNNTPSNLVICQDQKYHYLLHARARVVRAGGNPNTEQLCCKCKVMKPLAEFNLQASNSARGRQTQCRQCQSDYFKVWKERKQAARKAA